MHTTTERRIKRLARLNRAAAYVDESRTSFWRHVKSGVWPEPIDVAGIPFIDLNEIDERIEAMKAARTTGEAA